MPIQISITSNREGILTIKSNTMTLITDQEITEGAIINSVLHVNGDNKVPINFHVDEIEDRRISRGDWKTTPPCGIK